MQIGYARVSTSDQNLDLQIDALTSAGCTRIFKDKESGSVDDRCGLSEALEFVRPGDTLVVWKLDRLGRSIRHLIDTVTKLQEQQIGFKSLQEAIDSNSPGGKLVFHLFAALAEFERAILVDRTKAGLAAARARGRVGGRPLKMEPHKIQIAKTLMAEPGHQVAVVAKTLGVSRSTLYRHLP